MTPEDITAHFTRTDGSYVFARWGRPIAPVVFGVEDAALGVIKGAIEAVTRLAGHEMTETDPELGANLMYFFVAEWDDLTKVPKLDGLVPELGPLVARLKAADANQYRLFRFDTAGAIKAAFVFVRMDAPMAEQPAQTLALAQAVQVMLLWGEGAFAQKSPLAVAPGGAVILRPEIGDLIRAGYDPVLPVAANEASHALRLFARMQQP